MKDLTTRWSEPRTVRMYKSFRVMLVVPRSRDRSPWFR